MVEGVRIEEEENLRHTISRRGQAGMCKTCILIFLTPFPEPD